MTKREPQRHGKSTTAYLLCIAVATCGFVALTFAFMYPAGQRVAATIPLRNRSANAYLSAADIELVAGGTVADTMAARNGAVPSQPLLQGVPPSERTRAVSGWGRARARAHDLVEGSIDTWFEYSLLAVIFGNVIALLLASVPVTDNGKAAPW